MRNNIYSSLVLLSLFIGSCSQKKNENCFRRTTDAGWEKVLPEGICLPSDEYAVGFVIDDVDFNQDGLNDLIIRYYKSPRTAGDTVFYEFFIRERIDFKSIGIYSNISPPILGSTLGGARNNPDSLVRQLFELFPYSLEISFKNKIMILSQRIPDDYGKNHVFVFDHKLSTWILDRVEYWAGDFDKRYLERMELSEELLGKVILETREPTYPIQLKEFDLIESKKEAYEERDHFELKYDIFEIGG